MSWQKGSNYFGVDVDAIADGKPASAHLLRLLSRNANYLGGSPRNLLTVGPCQETGVSGEAPMTTVVSPDQWRVISEWPVFKPTNVERATLYIDGGVSDLSTVLYEVTTSRGTYVTETVGDLSPEIPVLLRRGRLDFLRLRARCVDGELGAASYGTPTSGGVDTLLWRGGGIWQIDSSLSPNWTVSAPNFATSGHAVQFYSTDGVAATYQITSVLATDEFVLAGNVPTVTSAGGAIRPGFNFTSFSWRVRRPPLLALTGVSLISDEVSP